MSGRLNRLRIRAALLAIGLLIPAATATPAGAASHDQIVDMCRQAMRPQIQACALAKGLKGDPEAVRQQCGAPLVRPCVMREEAEAGGRRGGAGGAERRGPDRAHRRGAAAADLRCAAAHHRRHHRHSRQREAGRGEDRRPQGRRPRRSRQRTRPPPTLAQFYYDRGNARALLARNKEALADGLQALAVAKGGVEYRQLMRIRQFVSLEYRALGDPKDAIAIAESTVREADAARSPRQLDQRLGEYRARR